MADVQVINEIGDWSTPTPLNENEQNIVHEQDWYKKNQDKDTHKQR